MKKLIFLLLSFCFANAHAQQVFSDLESLLKYADGKSTSVQSNLIKLEQAQKAKRTAMMGIPDPNGNISFTYTDNTELPVSVFPAETFGGTPGTYQVVRSGVQYNTNFNRYAELKLLNVKGWKDFSLAKSNVEKTVVDNKLTLKNLYENIATSYFTILQLNEQLKSTRDNLAVADTLLQIAENKFKQGLVRQQDVNDSKANYLSTKENAKQIEFLITTEYTSLKILADIPHTDSVVLLQPNLMPSSAAPVSIEKNMLNLNSSLLAEKIAFQTFRKNRFSNVPTISLFTSRTSQQFNPNAGLFDSNVDWLGSSYIGFKVATNLPSASSISQTKSAQYDYQLAKKNAEHARIQSELSYQQLGTDYEKNWSQYVTNKELYLLKKDTYQKNLNLYVQGLLGLDLTLNSFNAMVNSDYSRISSAVQVLLSQAKIEINNRIQ